MPGNNVVRKLYADGTIGDSVKRLATVPLLFCASVPYLPLLYQAVCVLVGVNIGLGIWIAMYLTMAQDISQTHVSTSIGVLSGSGSLAGALAMWAVGKITKASGSFAIPMTAFALAAAVAACAGWIASREPEAVRRQQLH
jgi:cyanate permease